MKHLDNNTWPLGLSWTKGYDAIGYNPDGTQFPQHLHSGPFIFLQFNLNSKTRRMLEMYFGFKPTPDQDPKFDVTVNYPIIGRLIQKLAYWKFRHNIGNLNCALRVTGY